VVVGNGKGGAGFAFGKVYFSSSFNQ